jgi:hypothetical protein
MADKRLVAEEEAEEKKLVVRRVKVFEPRHIAIVPFRAGDVASFAHLDHRLIRAKILNRLENKTLLAVAQVSWLLHDDAILLLEQRAQAEFGIPDALLFAVAQKYGYRGDPSSVDWEIINSFEAKNHFMLADAQVKQLFPRASRGITVRQAVEACRERFGCLGHSSVYKWKLRVRRLQRLRELHEREDQVERVLKQLKLNCSSWPDGLEAFQRMRRWVRWGTGATLEEVEEGLQSTAAKLEEVRSLLDAGLTFAQREAAVLAYVERGPEALEAFQQKIRAAAERKRSKAEGRVTLERQMHEVLQRRGWKKRDLPSGALWGDIVAGRKPLAALEELIDKCEAKAKRTAARDANTAERVRQMAEHDPKSVAKKQKKGE